MILPAYTASSAKSKIHAHCNRAFILIKHLFCACIYTLTLPASRDKLSLLLKGKGERVGVAEKIKNAAYQFRRRVF
jgi:hypothetical protein